LAAHQELRLKDSPASAQRARTRRRRLLRRGLPALLLVGLAAGGAGLLVAGALGDSETERTAKRFGSAWERGDYAAMYALLSPAARERYPLERLVRIYESARRTATLTALSAGEASDHGGDVGLRVRLRTRVFGTLLGELLLPVDDGLIDWAPHLAFPGLAPGERLRRLSQAPPRARILARDGSVIAEGPAVARTSPLGPAGGGIAGQVAPAIARAERDELFVRGFPRDAPVGRSGLERILETELAGTPGGRLLASERVLARAQPREAADVKTTIDPEVQAAAVQALAGRFGGIAALDARTAEVRALAGIAFSAPQPPGSTFKLVTATAALEARLVRSSTPFPVATKAVIDGVDLENAHGESCGGTFAQSFAHSCNSVFAPLGVRIGAERLVATAERYGFNGQPALAGASPSTLPKAGEIRSPLELGSTAIGQGRVLATPLELASMAQTVASDGLRREPTVRPGRGGAPRPVRVTSRRVARIIERLMIGVVEYGTGRRASLAPTKVAGKTGTAELEDTTDEEPGPEEAKEPPGFDTDAWFTAYAPVRRPRLAVAVLLVRQGAGGDTAAPAARLVLQAGLR
jgi:hypothetical protein